MKFGSWTYDGFQVRKNNFLSAQHNQIVGLLFSVRMQNFGVVQLADGLNVFEQPLTTNLAVQEKFHAERRIS